MGKTDQYYKRILLHVECTHTIYCENAAQLIYKSIILKKTIVEIQRSYLCANHCLEYKSSNREWNYVNYATYINQYSICIVHFIEKMQYFLIILCNI